MWLCLFYIFSLIVRAENYQVSARTLWLLLRRHVAESHTSFATRVGSFKLSIGTLIKWREADRKQCVGKIIKALLTLSTATTSTVGKGL